MLFDLLQIIESTCFAKADRSDQRRSEWANSNITSINKLNCRYEEQPDN